MTGPGFATVKGLNTRPMSIGSSSFFSPSSTGIKPEATVSGLQKDLYIKGFGFFCKKEMQIEKSVRLPLRFRLGSLEQCNILEQKY
ncbi:MAG: hypothetical protein EOP48_01855 [Sphingobacteriales bacterium]|nr:MAG: hypothetical protein EOP48_01855 [Sphingobacteriales bacterium]